MWYTLTKGDIMKKIKLVLTLLFLSQALALANYNDIYIADIQYDWINKSEVEKEAIISEVHDIIFENERLSKIENFKTQFKNLRKDKNYKEHYLAASAGYKEYKDNNISAFYFKKQKHIYMYALQNKKDISKSYITCY